MEKCICLDSDFLIYFLRGNKEANSWLVQNEEENQIVTSVINLFEVYYGAYKSNKPELEIEKIDEFADQIGVLNVNRSIVKEAGRIAFELEKKGETIEFRDLLIGCIAKEHNCSIKTFNKRHFEKIPNLKVE